MHFIILGLAAVLLATLALRMVCVFPLQPVKTAPRSLSDQQRSAALRMEADVRAIASVPHNLDHVPALEAAALYIEHELRAAGLLPKIQAFAVGKHTVRNIEVVFEPTAPATAVSLVVGAHYDSAGDSPGANDNGSGVAALLEICRSFALEPPAVSRRIRLVFFVNEEYPYGKTDAMGALRHARALKESGERVAGMIALETLGYFSDAPGSQRLPAPFNWIYPNRGNFVAFVALPGGGRFMRKALAHFRRAVVFPSTGTVVPSFVEGADLSDHWAYTHVGFPALMVTDTAPYRNPFYHQAHDLPHTVDYANLARVVEGLTQTLRTLTADA